MHRPGQISYYVRVGSYSARPTQVIAPRLGELLSKAMNDAGIKARPLAIESGVDKNTIGGWLKPDRDSSKAVKVASVESVAEVLDKTAEDLLGMSLGQEADKPKPASPEWLEAIERVDTLVKELATLIKAVRTMGAERQP